MISIESALVSGLVQTGYIYDMIFILLLTQVESITWRSITTASLAIHFEAIIAVSTRVCHDLF